MRGPRLRLIITFLIALPIGFILSFGLMLALNAEYRHFSLFLPVLAIFFALLAVFVLDKPLGLHAFQWPDPNEDNMTDFSNRILERLMLILNLGAVKGIIGMIVGAVIGAALALSIRGAMGLPLLDSVRVNINPTGFEVAAVCASLLGTIGFLIGVGALTDWLKWCVGLETPLHHGPPPGKPAWTRYFSVDYNHKVIGVQYSVTGILLLLIAGFLAIMFRLELAQPDIQFLTPNTFNTFISAHGMIMIGSILLGVGGLMNYLVPLMIGASDMAFPRLNAFGFWVNVPGAILLVAAIVLGGWDTGWTGYPPLSAEFDKQPLISEQLSFWATQVEDAFTQDDVVSPTGATLAGQLRGLQTMFNPLQPVGVQLFFIGVYFIGLSSIVGSANLLVTVARMRAKGMTLFRMPIFVWASVATSIIQLTATQLIGLSFLMVVVQRLFGMGFFDPLPALGMPDGHTYPVGNPILFQHLFWFYSHPAVYVFILPGLGIISELLPVFCRKPLFGYKWIALSSLAIALVGFVVWAHHMFTSGMEDFLRVPFMYSTMLVAIPTGVKFFSWLGTMWRGKLVFPTPMLFVLGGISVFLIGGLSGPPNATVSTDLFLHDTYWIVGHFHATMFGGFIFPFFAALYYWYPKVTGRMYNEFWGKVHFWMITPAFWVMSLGQMWVGLLGMRRRIVDYDAALGITGGHIAVTAAAIIIGISVIIMLINFILSARSVEESEPNPWGSRSPEWQIPSPIPEHSYAQPFMVVGDPYEYGLPGSSYVNMNPGATMAGGIGAAAASD